MLNGVKHLGLDNIKDYATGPDSSGLKPLRMTIGVLLSSRRS